HRVVAADRRSVAMGPDLMKRRQIFRQPLMQRHAALGGVGLKLRRLPRVLVVGVDENVVDVAELLYELLEEPRLVLDNLRIADVKPRRIARERVALVPLDLSGVRVPPHERRAEMKDRPQPVLLRQVDAISQFRLPLSNGRIELPSRQTD